MYCSSTTAMGTLIVGHPLAPQRKQTNKKMLKETKKEKKRDKKGKKKGTGKGMKVLLILLFIFRPTFQIKL